MLTLRSDDDRNSPPPGVTVNTSALSRSELGVSPSLGGRRRKTSLLMWTMPSDGSGLWETMPSEGGGPWETGSTLGGSPVCPRRARDLWAATRLFRVFTVPIWLRLQQQEDCVVSSGLEGCVAWSGLEGCVVGSGLEGFVRGSGLEGFVRGSGLEGCVGGVALRAVLGERP